MRSCLGDQKERKRPDRNGSAAETRRIVNTVLTRKVSVPTDGGPLHAPAFDAWTRVDGQANLCAAAARMFLTCVYSHRPRCTLQVSFAALQPFLLWLTSLHSGVQEALSLCGQPDHPQPSRTYQARFTNDPTEDSYWNHRHRLFCFHSVYYYAG